MLGIIEFVGVASQLSAEEATSAKKRIPSPLAFSCTVGFGSVTVITGSASSTIIIVALAVPVAPLDGFVTVRTTDCEPRSSQSNVFGLIL